MKLSALAGVFALAVACLTLVNSPVAFAMRVPATPNSANSIKPSVTVQGYEGYEFYTQCDQVSPFHCGTTSGNAPFEIFVNHAPATITIGYTTTPVTATPGADYTPMSGTVTIHNTAPQAYIQVPVVDDGLAEPTETFTVKLTSSSVAATLGGPATVSILDGGNMPVGCSLSRTATTINLTCSQQPPAVQWDVYTHCPELPWGGLVDGNAVTGNGTSVVSCGGTAEDGGYEQLSP